MARIVPRRTTLLQKLAYILRPFVFYMLVKTFVMLAIAVAVQMLPIKGMEEWAENHSRQLGAVVNALASMTAVSFLLNDFLIEADTTGETDIDRNVFMQYMAFLGNGFVGGWDRKKATKLAGCIAAGIAAAFSLNRVIGFMMINSEKYKTVETIQYSVPVWLGLVLYGIVAPMVEEIVFRGVIYNRIKKFFGIPKAVVFSALLFGMFHGNLPQFLYGTAMGALIAVLYECAGCFAAPVLVHVSANVFAFLVSVLMPV